MTYEVTIISVLKALSLPLVTMFIVTGNSSIDPALDAVKYGVDGYLLEPFTMADLLESISHCFHKRSVLKL